MAKTLPDFFDLIAELFGVKRLDVERVARYAREAKAIPSGRRGPGGGGPEATPENVSNLIVGLLATDNREKSGTEGRQVWHLTPQNKMRQCTLTGARVFGGALREALQSAEIASWIECIRVGRSSERYATLIGKTRHGERQEVQFGKLEPHERDRMHVEAVLGGDVLRILAAALAEDGAGE